MASYNTQYCATGVPIPTKEDQYPSYPSYYQSIGSAYSASPPEDHDASVTSGVPSWDTSGYSVTASSYAGSSSGDYDSTGSASGIDFNEYVHDRFAESFDPIPLDRSLAQQAQT